jgi:hypothetical protein
MIDEIDRQLTGWIGTILDKASVSLAPPGPPDSAKGVGLYLMELVQSQATRGTRRPPLLMTLRYLVTTQAPKPEDAHQMLGALVIAALQNPDFEIEQDPLPLSLWTTLGIAPRPAFVLRVPFRQERPEQRAPLVRKSLVVKQLPIRTFGGQVVGPQNIPIMNARVDMPSLDLTTTTDSKGRFYFSSVPAVSGARLLVIRAKGQEFSINTQQTASEKEPLVIQLQLEG